MNQICKSIGRAFTIDRDWYVETEDGREIPVVSGEIFRVHSLLARGRDENRQVYYDELAGGFASVSGFAK